jgi:hypothetical protein
MAIPPLLEVRALDSVAVAQIHLARTTLTWPTLPILALIPIALVDTATPRLLAARPLVMASVVALVVVAPTHLVLMILDSRMLPTLASTQTVLVDMAIPLPQAAPMVPTE